MAQMDETNNNNRLLARLVPVSSRYLIRGATIPRKRSSVCKFWKNHITDESPVRKSLQRNLSLNRARWTIIRCTLHFGWWAKFPVDTAVQGTLFSSGHKLFTSAVCPFHVIIFSLFTGKRQRSNTSA